MTTKPKAGASFLKQTYSQMGFNEFKQHTQNPHGKERDDFHNQLAVPHGIAMTLDNAEDSSNCL